MTINLSNQKPWKNLIFPSHKALSAFTRSCAILGLFSFGNILHSAVPVIDPNPGGTTISYPENDTSPVTTVDITDPDGIGISNVELFGVNADEFSIVSSGGDSYELSFNSPPDYEGPTTTYLLSIKATDLSAETSSLSFTINVTDVSEGPIIISSSTFARQEVTVSNPNDVSLFTVLTDIPATQFTVSGGADQAAFTIGSATGVLQFINPPDYDDPHDSNDDNIYHVDITANNGVDPDTKSFVITIVDVNEAPVILQPTKPGFAYPENDTSPVATIDVEDPDGDAITSYQTSGADVSLFSFNSTTGRLSFLSPPNYESPLDDNSDNIYEIKISARDSFGKTGSISLFVGIEDVNDKPTFTIDTTSSLVTDTGGGAIRVDGYETRENGGTGFTFSAAALSKITVADEDHDGSGLPAPELWIKLDEGSGTAISDSSGNGHTITFKGNNPTPSWPSGTDATHNRDYTALEFNGTTDYLEISDVPSLRPGLDNYSVSFWFQLNNTATSMPFFNKGLEISPNPTDGILAYFHNNDIVFRATDGTALAHAFEPSVDTDWHHLTAVINRNTDKMTLYIDAVPHVQTSGYVSSNVDDLSTMTTIDNTNTILIGKDLATPTANFFRGILDDIRVYLSPLSASQVSELYTEATDNTVTMTLQVSKGTLTLGNPGVSGITFSTGDGTADSSMVFSGTVTTLTSALEGMTYDPNEEFNGTDQLNYHISDTDDNGTVQLGTLSYTLNVQAINDAPENQVPLPQTINEGSTLTFRLADGNGISVTDDATDNSGDIQVTLTTPASTGTMTLGVTADLTFSAGDGSQDTTMTFRGTVDKVNDALDSLTYSLDSDDGGNPDFNGVTTITITTNDLGNYGLDDITNPSSGSASQQETDLDIITINVTAVNDPISFISGSTSVAENETDIYQITVNDPDLNDSPSTETTTFSITGGADAAFFNLAADGTLTFTTPLDFEVPQDANGDNIYLVTIRAQDSAGNFVQSTFSFTITDVNEGPSLNVPISTAISVVEGTSNVLTTITYSDPEDENVGAGTLSLTLSGDDAALFSLNTGNGQLTFLAPPDFETPLDADADNVYEVAVVATDSAPTPNTDTLWFAITVTDDNDAPSINLDDTASFITDLGGGNYNITGFETSENSTPGFVFSSAKSSAITISDPDYDSSGLPSPTLWLKLNQQSGTSIIDFSAYEFTASLQGGNPSPVWISETDLTHGREVQALQLNGTSDYIRVQDATVLRPGLGSYTLSLWFKPNSTAATQALFAKGTAVDTTNTEGFLAYLKGGDAVVRAADGNLVAHAFAPSITVDWHHFVATFNRNKELLTLYFDNVAYPQQIGYDGSNSEDLADFEDVQPIDAIEIGYDGTNYFAGALDDIRIYNTPLNISQVAELYSENTPGELELTLSVSNGTLSLADPAAEGITFTAGDGTSDASMTFTGTTSALNNALNGLSYTPTDDFNGTDTLNISVVDTDEHGTESDSAAYTLTVQAINRAPVINIPTGQALDEGTSITFQAASANGISITDDADENPGTEEIEVTLQAQVNTGVLSLGTTTGLTFTTGDGDKDVVITFTGTLADANAALDTLSFSLLGSDGGDDDFNGSATITITVNDQANYGADDQLVPNPAQATQEEITTVILTLTVNPVNDPFTINENSSTMNENDSVALTLTVDDPDTTDTHTFVIIGGADQTLFEIDTNSGVLSFLSPPDFENPLGTISDNSNTYYVTVLATDSGGLTDSQALEITVFDVNDVPTFITTEINYSPLENQTAVADIDAEDQDVGQTLQYSIASGTYSSLFTIDSSTGVLSFLTPPDFENPGYVNADSFYTIDIHATDDGGSPLISAPLSLTITLTDENEVPNITTSSTLDMDEEQTAVTTITVSDPDAGDSHTFSVVDGLDMDFFTIDTNSGLLSFVSAPSFENPLGSIGDGNTYEVIVRATDSGGLFDDHVIDITIEDINDAPVFTIPSSAFTADENQTLAEIITAEDEDEITSDFYSELSFSLPSGLDLSKFALSVTSTDPTAASANLNFLAAPDYENPTDSNLDTIYAVTVQVSDGVNVTTEDLSITINNINDAPVFTALPGLQVVNEDETKEFGASSLNPITVNDEDIVSDGSDVLEVTLSVDDSNGTLSITGQAGLAHVGDGTDTLVLTANPDILNSALDTLTFTGAQDFHGTATLRILIDDFGSNLGAALTTERTVSITVNPINDAPTAHFPIGSPATNEDTPYTFVFGTSTSLSVEDVDDPTDTQRLTVTLSMAGTDAAPVSPAYGKLQLASSTNLTFTTGNGISPFSKLVFSGTIADINNALDGMVFTPATNFNGIATMDVKISDVSLTNNLVWEITVNPVNDPPVITLPEQQYVDEDDSIYFRTVSNVAQVDHVTFSNGASGDAFTFTLDGESIVVPFSTTVTTTAIAFAQTVNTPGVLPPTVVAVAEGSGVVRLTASTPGNPFDASISVLTNKSGFASASVQTTTLNVSDNTVKIWDDASETSSNVSVRLSVSHGVLTFSSINNITFDTVAGGTPIQAQSSGANLFVISGTVEALNAALQWIEYIPTANFNGDDALFLTVDDKGNNGSGGTQIVDQNVIITINPLNDGPTVTAPTTPQFINEDSTLTFNTSNGNAVSVSDPDAGEVGGQLLVTIDAIYGKVSLSSIAGLTTVSGSTPTAQSMSFTGLEADINNALNNLRYIPNANHNNNISSDAITISVNDQANHGTVARTDSKTIPVSITPVNDPPTIVIQNRSPSINEGNVYVFSAATATPIVISDDAFEVDGTVQVTISSGQGVFTLASTLNLDIIVGGIGQNEPILTISGKKTAIDAALNGLTYRPLDGDGFGFSGTDTLTFLVQDLGNEGTGGFLEGSTTVNITVQPVNDAPVHYFNGSLTPTFQTAIEDTPFIFSSSEGNAITVADDASEAGFEVRTTLQVSRGTLTLGDTSGLFLVFTQGDGNEDTTMTFQATVDDVNTALEGLIFDPAPNSNDDVILTITTNDLNNTGSGGALQDSDLVFILVDPVNDAPSVSVPSTAVHTLEDISYTFTGSRLFSISDDASEAALSVSATVSTTRGTLELSLDEDEFAAHNITRLSGFNGTRQISISGPVNSINTALNGLKYTPDSDYVGTDTVTLLVEDQGNHGDGNSLSDQDAATVIVDPVNDAPQLLLPGDQIAFEDNFLIFSDATSNPITISDVDTYSPSSALQITVKLTNLSGTVVNNRGTLTLGTRNNLIFSTGDGTDDYTMTFKSTIGQANAAFEGMVFTPADDYSGDLRLHITVNDQGNTGIGGALIVEDYLEIQVGPTNDTPIILMPSSQSVNEDGQLVLSGSSIQVFDDASPTDKLFVAVQVTNGTVQLGSTTGLTVTSTPTSHSFEATLDQIELALDGLTYTPTANYNGSATLTITVNDQGAGGNGNAASDSQILSLTVVSINDRPTLTLPSSPTVKEGGIVSLSQFTGYPITIADVDAGSANIKVTMESDDGIMSLGSTAGVILQEGDGFQDARIVFLATLTDANKALTGMTFSPNPQPSTTGQILFTVDDQGNTGLGGTLSTTKTLTLNINKQPPVIQQGTSVLAVMKDNLPSSWVQPTITAIDENNETLTWSLHSQASSGAATVTGTGLTPTIVYVPNAEFIGNDAFIVRVTDASGNTDTILVNVIVNSPPIITTTPPTVHKGGVFNYSLSVIDADSADKITFTALQLPYGITLLDHRNRTATVTGTFANPPSVTPWSDSVEVATGWRQNWFGIFHIPEDSNGWVYHAEFGWVYSQSSDPANFWFWTDLLGWTWTSQKKDFRIAVAASDGHSEDAQEFNVTVGVFPLMYSDVAASWLYYEDGHAPAQVYFYAEDRWTTTIYNYNINAQNPGDPNAGVITGAGTYDRHKRVTLTATPNEDYNFLGWSGDIVSSSRTISFNAVEDINVYANFEAKIYHQVQVLVTDNTTATPTVKPAIATVTGLASGGRYEIGTTATLQVAGNPGYIFQGWTGDTSSLGLTPTQLLQTQITFTVLGSYTLRPNFYFDFAEWQRQNP